MNKQNRNKLRCGKHSEGCQMGGVGGLGAKGEGIGKDKLPVIETVTGIQTAERTQGTWPPIL